MHNYFTTVFLMIAWDLVKHTKITVAKLNFIKTRAKFWKLKLEEKNENHRSLQRNIVLHEKGCLDIPLVNHLSRSIKVSTVFEKVFTGDVKTRLLFLTQQSNH